MKNKYVTFFLGIFLLISSFKVRATAPTITSFTLTTPICQGSMTTLTVNATGGGTYMYTFTASSGPVPGTGTNTTGTYTVSVTPTGTTTYTVTVSNGTLPNATQTAVVTVNASPTTSNAGTPQSICSTGSATLAANTPTSGTGAWSVSTGPSLATTQFSSLTSPTATFTPAGGAGSYVLVWTISNAPCTASTSNVTITVEAPPTVSSAGPNQTICSSGSATLAANAPTTGTGAWSVSTGPSLATTQFSSTTNRTATFTPAGGAGTYVLVWTISNSPCTASTSNVTITVTAGPTTSNAGTPQTICSTGSAILAANTPTIGTGAWSVSTGPSLATTQFSSLTSPTATFTPAGGAGSYVLVWTISNSPCPASTSNVTITVEGSPTASNAGSNQTICSTANATLAANTPTTGTGAWSVSTGPSTALSQFSSTTSPTARFTPAGGAGSYVLVWTISNSPCVASTSNVTITVEAPPTTSNAGSSQTICSTGSATLAANTPTTGTGAWSVSSGPSTALSQFSSSTSPTATFTPAGGAGSYVLVWTISNSPCTASATSITITVEAPPTISNAGSTQTICSSGHATLAANTPTTGTGVWSVSTGPSTALSQFSSTTSPTATFTPAGGAGSYVLVWTISNAPCTASTSNVTITVTGGPTTSNAGPNQTICSTTTSVNLAANTPTVGTGAWTVSTGPSTLSTQFSNTASPTSTFTPGGGAGAYVLVWTISNNPCTASTSSVTITVEAPPTTSSAGSNQTICSTGNANLAANAPTIGTGAWSVLSGPSILSTQFSSVGNPTASFTPAGGAGSYVLVWTISNNPCIASTSSLTITVIAPPTVSSAGSGQTICSTGSAILAANTPTIGTGAWSVLSGPSTLSTQFSNTSSPASTFTPASGAGTYVLVWTISNAPCNASTSDVTITVIAPPTVSNAGSNQTICSAGNAVLAANAATAGTGSWSVSSGPSTASSQFSNTSSPSATFTPAGGSGSYVLVWTISNPPCTPTNSSLTITVIGVPTVSNAGSNQTVCVAAGSTALAANTPSTGTGAWSVLSGPSISLSQFSNVSSPTSTFSPAGGSGSYVLEWTIISPPCNPSVSSVTITVIPQPTTSNAGSNDSICITGVEILGANTPSIGTGLWSVSGPSNSTSQFSSTTNPTAIFTPAGGAGTYTLTWSISNSPCNASVSSVTLKVDPLITGAIASSTKNDSICFGAMDTLKAIAAGGTIPYTYSWSPGGLTNSSITVTPLTKTTYSVYINDEIGKLHGCFTIDSITVNVDGNVTVSPSPVSVCSGSMVPLYGNPSGGVTPYSFSWSITTPDTIVFESNTQISQFSEYYPNGKDTCKSQNARFYPPYPDTTGHIDSISYFVIDSWSNGGCPSKTQTIAVTIDSVPKNPIIPVISACDSSLGIPFSVTFWNSNDTTSVKYYYLYSTNSNVRIHGSGTSPNFNIDFPNVSGSIPFELQLIGTDGCVRTKDFNISVGSGLAPQEDSIAVNTVIFNDTTNIILVSSVNTVVTYQWGYTDCNFINHNISGQTNQSFSYSIPPGLDTNCKYYYVEVCSGSCCTYTYYNPPPAITPPPVLSTGSISNPSDVFNVYPNPNNGSFKVQLPEDAADGKLELFNIFGQQIYSYHIGNNDLPDFNLHLPSGIYMIKYLNKNGVFKYSSKFIIQN